MIMKNLSRGSLFLWLLILLAISSTVLFDSANAENVTEPRRNNNLNPTQRWRSAVECMWNKSEVSVCKERQQLSLNVTIEVLDEEMGWYCQNGCLDHTLAVLDCINDVNRDFWFANKFDTWTLRRLLADKCANLTGFSYKDIHVSGAIQVSQKMILSIVIPLLASIYINHLPNLM